MKKLSLALVFGVLATGSFAQTIEILSIEEVGETIEISIRTDMATPFEVMAGVDLANQKPKDIYIGSTARMEISAAEQMLVVPLKQDGAVLPSGDYTAEVSFYPAWGAENAPAETKAVTEKVVASVPITLAGSGGSVEDKKAMDKAQAWVFDNVWAGSPFDFGEISRNIGFSEITEVAGSHGNIQAHYFPQADMTIFLSVNTQKALTWVMGRKTEM